MLAIKRTQQQVTPRKKRIELNDSPPIRPNINHEKGDNEEIQVLMIQEEKVEQVPKEVREFSADEKY